MEKSFKSQIGKLIIFAIITAGISLVIWLSTLDMKKIFKQGRAYSQALTEYVSNS